MSYTEELAQMGIPKKESQELAESIYDVAWLMVEMSQPTVTLADVDIDDDDWDEKFAEHGKQFDRHMAYLELAHAIFEFAHCQRRSFKMYCELDKAIEEGERLGLNIY